MFDCVEAPSRPARCPVLQRVLSWLVLILAAGTLATGAALHLAGNTGAGDAAWVAAGVLGTAYAAVAVGAALASHRLGVDLIALFALGGALYVGEYLAAAVIGLMLASGRSLESWAAGRARRDLRALIERMPRSAQRRKGSSLETIDLDSVVPGDVLVVASSALVPVDGELLGSGVFDESSLTGESAPVNRHSGDIVPSGIVNAGSPVEIRAVATASESTYAGVVRLVRESEGHPARFVRLADRYALWFLGVTFAAAGVAWGLSGLARAVAVLVVATPCPLILAVPVAFVAGTSQAARRGIVVKGAVVLERLARCTTLLIDKTGTVTKGRPELEDIIVDGPVGTERVLVLAASLEQFSPHVLASAVVAEAHRRGYQLFVPRDVEERVGQGIRGNVMGYRVEVGTACWAHFGPDQGWARSARRRAWLAGATTIFVAIDGEPVGVLLLIDPIRPDAGRTVASLRGDGIERVVMVSGDRREVAETIGAVIGVDEVLAERMPAEKLDTVRFERTRAPVVMVGDGINDAPALALADVGVALAARGATASSEAADIALTVDRLGRVGAALRLARRTVRIATGSVLGGMGLSLAAMGVAGSGHLPAVWGALFQEAIDVAVIGNSLRALHPESTERRVDPRVIGLLDRFRAEHQQVNALLDRVLAEADALGSLQPGEVVERLRPLHRLLTTTLGPHEEQEERALYPVMGRFLGSNKVTGTMSRSHVEILHRIRTFGRILDDMAKAPPTEADVNELRRALYGLHAIVEMHNRQEEETLFSLADESGESSRLTAA